MHKTRRKGLEAVVFAAVAAFILLKSPGFGSPRPGTLSVGLVMLLLAMWESMSGSASLIFRRVTKGDAPTLFWSVVFFTASIGIACVALSYV